jgi:hypothetical protein
MQQLIARKLLPNNRLARCAEADEVKDRLVKIDAECVNLHGPPPVYASYIPEEVKAADHPITYAVRGEDSSNFRVAAIRQQLTSGLTIENQSPLISLALPSTNGAIHFGARQAQRHENRHK